MNAASPSRPRPRQVLLGLFVLGQFAFILTANFLPHIRTTCAKHSWPGEQPIGLVVEGGKQWSSATGQLQGWSLFAPAVPKQSVFIAVELRWDDDAHWPAPQGARRQILRSAIEPDDPQSYFRPFGSFRVSGYEAQLCLPALAWDAAAYRNDPDDWRDRLAAGVRREHRAMQAYLAWRGRDYQRQHPDEPAPRQFLLLARLYKIPPPEQRPWSWDGPVEQPIARWRPAHLTEAGFLPVEPFNPATRQFEPIPQEATR